MNAEELKARQSLSGLTIQHSSFAEAYNTILDTIEYNKSTQSPEPNSILVLGESGVGKTTLNSNLLEVLPGKAEVKEEFNIVTKVPFFHSSLGTDATPSKMAADLLSSMGVEDRNKFAADKRIRFALKRAETQAILYDELHNLAGSLTPHKIGLARGWIRDLITSTRVMIIGFGTPNCEDIFLSEAQVYKRFPIVLRLKNFSFSLDPKSEFVIIVKTLEREILRFHNLYSNVEPRLNEDFLIKLYATTGGSINAIKKLYEQAQWIAFKSDKAFNLEKFQIAANKLSFSTGITKNGFKTDKQLCLNMIANAQEMRSLEEAA